MGGSVRYSCAGECDGFDIRSTDGVVVLTKQVDAEIDSHHEFVAVATDSGIPQLSATAMVVIHGKYIYAYVVYLFMYLERERERDLLKEVSI